MVTPGPASPVESTVDRDMPERSARGPHRATSTTILYALIAAVILIVHVLVTVVHTHRAWLTFDSAEYAIAGRDLARTGRLTTPFSYPYLLSTVGRPPFPLVAGHPVEPVLDAILFRTAGARPGLTLIPPAIGYLVVVVLASRLARRASGSEAAAAVAALAVALTPNVLFFTSAGLSELPFTALFLAALLLLDDVETTSRAVWLGVCLGLAHLTRPIVVPMLPVWIAGAAWMAPPGRRARTVAAVCAGFLPAVIVLALYRFASTGSFAEPGGVLFLTELAPPLRFVRLVRLLDPPAPSAYLMAHPGEVVAKVLRHSPRLLFAAFTGGGGVIGMLFIIHLIAPDDLHARRLRLVIAGLFAALFATIALTVPNESYFFPLVPVIVALGIAEAHRLALARRFSSRAATLAVIGIALLCSALPTSRQWHRAWTAGERDRGAFTETDMRAAGEALRERLPAGAMVASDVGPWLCWYADVPATLLPADPADLRAMARRVPLDALVVTNEWLIDLPGEEEWRAVYSGRRVPPGWRHLGWIVRGRLRLAVLVPGTRRAAQL